MAKNSIFCSASANMATRYIIQHFVHVHCLSLNSRGEFNDVLKIQLHISIRVAISALLMSQEIPSVAPSPVFSKAVLFLNVEWKSSGRQLPTAAEIKRNIETSLQTQENKRRRHSDPHMWRGGNCSLWGD